MVSKDDITLPSTSDQGVSSTISLLGATLLAGIGSTTHFDKRFYGDSLSHWWTLHKNFHSLIL